MTTIEEINSIIIWYYNLPGDYNQIMVLHEKSRKLAALIAFFLKEKANNKRLASNAEIIHDTNKSRIEESNHELGVLKAKTIAKLQTEKDRIHEADCKLLADETDDFIKQANRIHDDMRSWITTLREEKNKTNYDYESDKNEAYKEGDV